MVKAEEAMPKDVTAEETILSKIASRKIIGLCLILLVFVTAAIHTTGWKNEKLIVLRWIRGRGLRLSVENNTLEDTNVFSNGTNVLVIVRTEPNHTDLRYAIRSTWGNAVYLSPSPIKVYFVVEARANFTSKEVQEEYKVYKDIFIADITDSSTMCATAHLEVFKKMFRSCVETIHYVIKTTDNVYLNLPYIYDYLSRTKAGLMMGNLYSSRTTEWTDSEEENATNDFHENTTEYLVGSTYVMSEDVVHDLCLASQNVSREDASESNRYITGTLAAIANVTLTNHQMFTYIENVVDPCILGTIAVSHRLTPSAIVEAHNALLKPEAKNCSGTIYITWDNVYFSETKLIGPGNPYGPSIVIRNQ